MSRTPLDDGFYALCSVLMVAMGTAAFMLVAYGTDRLLAILHDITEGCG